MAILIVETLRQMPRLTASPILFPRYMNWRSISEYFQTDNNFNSFFISKAQVEERISEIKSNLVFSEWPVSQRNDVLQSRRDSLFLQRVYKDCLFRQHESRNNELFWQEGETKELRRYSCKRFFLIIEKKTADVLYDPTRKFSVAFE